MKSKELFEMLLMATNRNFELLDSGKKPVSIAITGNAGIGKTSLIKRLAESAGYKLTLLNLAQLEDCGDLLGIPKIQDGKTVYMPPQWAASLSKEKRNILLLDDFNRANPSIQQSAMEIIDQLSFIGWELPQKTVVILTMNLNDSSGSSFFNIPQELDLAQRTRFISFPLEFDLKDWLDWARGENFPDKMLKLAETENGIILKHFMVPRTFAKICALVQKSSSNTYITQLVINNIINAEDKPKIENLLTTFFSTYIEGTDPECEIFNKIFQQNKAADISRQINMLLDNKNPVEKAKTLSSFMTYIISYYKKAWDDKIRYIIAQNIFPLDLQTNLIANLRNKHNFKL